MSNDYFDSADYTALSALTKARAAGVNSPLQAIEAGFDRLPGELTLKSGKVSNIGTFGGTATALTSSLYSTVVVAYADGLVIEGKAGSACAGATTVNHNSLGAKAIKRPDRTDVQASDWLANDNLRLRYNSTLGYFILEQPTALGIIAAAQADADAAAASAAAAAADAVQTAADRVQTGLDRTAAASSASSAASSLATVQATLAHAMWRRIERLTSADSPYTVVYDVSPSLSDNGTLFMVDTSSGAVTINLPQISGIVLPFNIGIIKDAGSNSITVNRSGTDTLDGAASITITDAGTGAELYADNQPSPDEWEVVLLGYASVTEGPGIDVTAAQVSLDIDNLIAETAPATDDLIAVRDTSAAAHRKMTAANLLKVIGSLTAESSPDVADIVALYDASAGTADGITLSDLLKIVNGLTEDASPDPAADFVLSYDASAAAAKKVKVQNIGGTSVSAQSGNFTAGTTPNTIYVVSDTADGTLPSAAAVANGFRATFKNATDGKGVRILPDGSDAIDGLSAYRVPGREIVEVMRTGAGVWTVTRTPAWVVGDVKEWGTNTLPDGGWAWVNGQTLSRTTYKGLFDIWGTTYGVGDGSTTFGVRDDGGRVKAGRETMGGVAAASRLTSGGAGIDGTTLGAAGGAQTHTLVTGEMPSHSHSMTVYDFNGGAGSSSGATDKLGGAVGSFSTNSTGSGGAHQNTQPTIVTNFIVKT